MPSVFPGASVGTIISNTFPNLEELILFYF